MGKTALSIGLLFRKNSPREIPEYTAMTTPSPPEHNLALIQRVLRHNTLMQDWPDAVRDQLMHIARLVHHPRHADVMHGDGRRREVLVIATGLLEVSSFNAAGAKYSLGRLGPGDVTAMVRLLRGPWGRYHYQTLEESVIVHLPSDGLTQVLDAHPVLWKDVALFALERQSESLVSLHRQALAPLPENLASALLKLLDTEPRSGSLPQVHVSQGELAAMLAVTRQTINKELRHLAEQGIVVAEYGHLTILDQAALLRVAQEAPPSAATS